VSEAAVLPASQPATDPASSPQAEAQPSSSPASISSPLPSSAVARCVDAYHRAFKAERARTRNEFAAEKCAKKAFCAALPSLIGHQNIRDFIACIAQAMLLDVVGTTEASKLLYAAQVALAAVRIEPAPDKTRPQ
jgi:hypothetical protein